MRDSIEDAMFEVPDAQCPRCGRWEPDYDGFGILAHTQPAYDHGCGYCSHPAIDNGECGICGFLDREPYARLGSLILTTTNIGVPVIVRCEYTKEHPDQIAWKCIWGLFQGRWITMDMEKARKGQVLHDGDTIEVSDDCYLTVCRGELVGGGNDRA